MKRKGESSKGIRIIKGIYWRGNKVVKRTASVHSQSATLHAMDHLQMDHYRATRCEVYDDAKGVLHAVLERKGMQVIASYKRDPKVFK